MKAIILAAGIGSRLAPITDDIPKTLVQVNNKPILQYQIESYLTAGINDICIVVGYKGEMIQEFIRKNYSLENSHINFIKNHDYLKTNNMYSLYLVLKETNPESFIFSNGDVVVKEDLVGKLLSDVSESGIAYQANNFNDESMKLTIDNFNCINNISKQIPELEANGISIDFYKFSGLGKTHLQNEIFKTIEQKKTLDSWTEVAIANILHTKLIKGIDIGTDFWYEIDTMEDLKNAEKRLK